MNCRSANGVAVVVALLVTLVMSALMAGLILVSSFEVMIASNFRHGLGTLHAADAIAQRAIADLSSISNWDDVLAGVNRSTFVDGPPFGPRTLPDGTTLDLSQVLNLANCRRTTTCTDPEIEKVTTGRPWGLNNPRWQAYAYGRLGDILSNGVIDSPYYGVVLVGDDPSENDDDPFRDGGGGGQPGFGVLALRVEAFGPRRTRRILELIVNRTGPRLLRVVSWREVR
jgi:hypothetical protein